MVLVRRTVALCVLFAFSAMVPAQTPSTSASAFALEGFPSVAVVGTAYSIKVTASPTTITKIRVTASDKNIMVSSGAQTGDITLDSGSKPFHLQSGTAGAVTVTLADAANAATAVTKTAVVTSASSTALASCSSCFATLGAGAVLTNSHFGDYNNASNVLQATHLGAGTPQFVVGLAYKLPFRELTPAIYRKYNCTPDSFSRSGNEGADAFCYPWKAFISLKFSPDSSQTFNGFTYGVSHAIHKKLDVMLGLSFSAHNEVPPGFQQAAVYTVHTQQALGNPNYAQYNVQCSNRTACRL